MIKFKPLIDDILLFIKKNRKRAITGDILQRRLTNIVDKIEEVYKEIRNILHTTDGEIAELQGGFSELDTKVTQNGSSIANNKDRLDGIDTRLEGLDTKEAEQDSSIAYNKKTIQDNVAKMVLLEGDIVRIDEKDKAQDQVIKENSNKVATLHDMLGVAEGIATLDSNGKVTPSQLPDSIRHIIEGTYQSETEFLGKDGVVWGVGSQGVESNEFIDATSNKTYLWSGSKFVAIVSSLALGETSETAYAGNKGKKNAEDIVALRDTLVEQSSLIDGHEQRIQDNATNVAYVEEEIGRIDGDSNGLKTRMTSAEDDIKELYQTTQIKDLDVEITYNGFNYQSSDTADAIYNYAIKGGSVKIQREDKRYDFVEYRNRTALFRHVEVSADKVNEDRIEIYGTEATFKTIEYKAIFDATPLLTSFTDQTALEDTFIEALDKALGEKKLIFVSGNGTIYLLIGTSRSADKRTFTGVGGNSVYILSYGSNKIVSLDTYPIGAEIRIFNNKEGINILNIGLESSSQEIKEVFTDSMGEAILPHTGDIFNIYANSDVTNSGRVISMVEDSAEVRMEVEMSNFEDAKHHRIFFKMSYSPSAGLDTIRIVSKVESLIDPSKISSDQMDLIMGALSSVDTKADKAEVNCYNISALRQNKFAGLQEAISALNEYLADSPKYPAMEMNYVGSDNNVYKYIFVGVNGGGFTNPSNWKQIKIEA